jgi:hypothetical protein
MDKLSYGISDSFFSSYVVTMDGAALVCTNKHHDEMDKLSHGISDSFFSSYVVAMDRAALICTNKHA